MNRKSNVVQFLASLVSIVVLLATNGAVLASSPQLDPGCHEKVANGGMETDAAWVFPTTPATAGYSTSHAHGGLRSVRVGIAADANVYSYSSARQTVTIPATAASAQFSFFWYPISEEGALPAGADAAPASGVLQGVLEDASPSTPQAGDRQYVIIYDDAGQPLQTLLWTRSDLRAWQKVTADLTPYRGRTIMLLFGVYNDGGGGRTAMYVDDVSLVACEPARSVRVRLPLVLNTYPAPTPPACYEGFANGGFETVGGWKIRSNPVLADYVSTPVHSGLWSMRTGIPWGGANVESYSPVQQSVNFPDPTAHAVLSFWHYNAYGDAGSLASALPDQAALPHTVAELQTASFATDFFYAIGITEDDTIDWLLVERVDVHTFRKTVIDVSRYAGHQIRFQFGTYNGGTGGISRTFIDDASLEICGVEGPTPALPYLRQTLHLSTDTYPAGVAVKPDGQKVYVAQKVGDVSRLAVVQALPVLSIATQIPLGAEHTAPNGVALIDAAGDVAVSLRETATAHVVNAETGADVATIPANLLPNGIAVHDGYGYIANFGNDTITVFSPLTLAATGTLGVGHEPSHFAVTDGADLFVSMHGNGEIVRLHAGQIAGHFYGIIAPYGLAYDPSADSLYVANRGPSHTVTVLDGASGAVLDTLATGQEPYVLAINPLTGHLFVACGDRVKVYRTSDHTQLAEIAVPPGAEEGIAVDTTYNRVYVTSRSGHALSVIQDVAD